MGYLNQELPFYEGVKFTKRQKKQLKKIYLKYCDNLSNSKYDQRALERPVKKYRFYY